jgi:cobalt-zinc-cadmium efflux system outer membrane protein
VIGRIPALVAVWVLGGLISLANAAEPLTLDQALDAARQSNPEILAVRQELEIARGRLVRARYWNPFNPEVGALGSRREFAAGGAASDFAVSASQEIEVAGQRGARIEEAERNAERAEALVRDRERLLDAEVRDVFFAALAAQRRLLLQQRIEELNQRVHDAAGQRVQAGDSPRMEASLAAVRYGQSRKDTIAAETELASTLLELRRLLGMPPERAIEPRGDLRSQPTALPPAEALAHALECRPDLRAARAELERVQAEQGLMRRLRVPNPTIEGFYETETDGPEGADKIAGGSVRIPIPAFDRKQGELVALAAQELQARRFVDGTRRPIEKEVAQSFREYQAARRTLEIFEADVLGRVEESFRFIEEAYREGKIDLPHFVVVQNDLVMAQLSYLDSLTRFRKAEVGLQRATGGPSCQKGADKNP